ncbi:MAG TPA: M24 family metallopeptidase [Mucilaginibacter sp.]|jgi:Xaa-Pro aminopeptidase|nr:M24 family metallopeptidase [Mucilaginibacter sp.]
MNNAKQKLAEAEQKAKQLFDMVEGLGLIVPGKSEKELAEEVVEAAKKHFGIEKFWHKKIVRTGPNTIHSYSANPPDLVIQKNDILFLDFGPIFDSWEADLGRTYVLGNDPLKLKLKHDVEAAWHEAKAWYDKQSHLTGAKYFTYLNQLATKYGWEFGGEIGGHIVGHFPHEQLAPDDLGLDVHPDNHSDIFQKDNDGNDRHWILEIQFADRVNNIGGFFEQLIDQSY